MFWIPGKGRRSSTATRPSQISVHGWKDILYRLPHEIVEDNLLLFASSCAFYSFLTLFPALATLFSLYGLILQPSDVDAAFQAMSGLMPDTVVGLLRHQVNILVSYSRPGLSVTLFIGLLLSIWSAMHGMKALIAGLNTAYEEREARGVLRLNGTALVLALGGFIFAIVALALIAALPPVLHWLAVPAGGRLVSLWRWPVLAVASVLALAVLYRFGPCRRTPKWRWVSWGAVLAAVLWLTVSILFSLYISNLAEYSNVYGTLGAIIVLLLWFYLSALVVLLGAEFNSEVELQTSFDTSAGGRRKLAREHIKSSTTAPKKH